MGDDGETPIRSASSGVKRVKRGERDVITAAVIHQSGLPGKSFSLPHVSVSTCLKFLVTLEEP